MAKRWLVPLLFVAGSLLGLWLAGPSAAPHAIWAAPSGPNTGDGDIGLAQRLAPAVDLLLFGVQPAPSGHSVYLPFIDR